MAGWQDGRISFLQFCHAAILPCPLFYCDAKTDVLHEAHVNDLQERQKFSGRRRRRRHADRHQQGAAIPGVSRKARRSGALSRFREHAQPGLQGTPAPEVEEGSDRSDDGELESDSAANHGQGVTGPVRLRQDEVRTTMKSQVSRLRFKSQVSGLEARRLCCGSCDLRVAVRVET